MFLPVVEKKRLLPENDKWPFLALDEEGQDLPADWAGEGYRTIKTKPASACPGSGAVKAERRYNSCARDHDSRSTEAARCSHSCFYRRRKTAVGDGKRDDGLPE
ncbi:hypothetical protein B0H14DRAFT_3467572 [Mycena olivaceomarginata]|nr:hypothetical protein B0H14DRAFT_3467572 [Mycena olivaceomarginata]